MMEIVHGKWLHLKSVLEDGVLCIWLYLVMDQYLCMNIQIIWVPEHSFTGDAGAWEKPGIVGKPGESQEWMKL